MRRALDAPQQQLPAKRGGGRKPTHNWEAIREEMFRLMKERGEFDGKSWNQAGLEKKLLQFCADNFGYEPSVSALREQTKIPAWLREIEESKRHGQKLSF